ncbi:MAG: glycosyl transferase family 1 [Candidatus Melainabacteria bacterium GWF2_37_15]|nr:MAG: glycosyl transferase family 1 [Candidatus Melainabacteria bacterium GWF2_37_15]
MKILFLHRNFPAQFRHLAGYLAQDKNNQVVFLTNRKDSPELPGVHKVLYGLHREVRPETHHYLRFTEESVLHGQGALRSAMNLRNQGFIPDVIIGHSWGPVSFMKEVFPESKIIAHIEWFYNSDNSDIDFISPPQVDTRAKTRYKNSHLLVDLYTCDKAITPTQWQLTQIPKEFHSKTSVIHEGIDTNYFKPDDNAVFNGFSKKDEIITYATRGMEPYRGFPQFMEAVSIIQKRRPNAHIIIAGEDRVCYGAKLPEGQTFKKLMLEKYDYDMNRLHFTGSLPYSEYLKLLQISSAHVYLTYPFVLSWSMLEAMACGCTVLASSTPPVLEVIKDEVNGLLFNFSNINEIAEKVDFVLDNKGLLDHLKTNARKTIVENYNLAQMIEKQVELLQ